ncbi:MAG: lipopolysaccharide biosynthesis protein, partial [Bacteroidota bacterium]
MGIVLRQSAQNTVVTFIGFAFGAINTLFLYTNILNPKYYGLVLFILATGALIMPLFALGSHNALLRFYTAQPAKEKRGFLGLMLITPLLVLVPAFLLTTCFKSELATLISKRN